MQNKVKYKIGDIEFESEGDADLIERERNEFISKLFPLAIEAITRIDTSKIYIDPNSFGPYITQKPLKIADESSMPDDLNRVSLATFIKNKGVSTETDFIVCAAYFDEQKNGNKSFSSESVKAYYGDARRTLNAENIGGTISHLIRKGHIIDAPDNGNTALKMYTLSSDGIEHVENMKSDNNSEKKVTSRPRKSKQKNESCYSSLNVDELNLTNYTSTDKLNNFKEKMMVALYIVTNENKGEWFTIKDIMCIMTDIFGEAATDKQIEGVIYKNKKWFKKEKSSEIGRGYERKLLNEGKSYAKKLIERDLNF